MISEHNQASLNTRSNTGFIGLCLQRNHFCDTKRIVLLQHIEKCREKGLLKILEIKKGKKVKKKCME